LIDLGKWASGGYRISSPIMDPELLEEVEARDMQTDKPNKNDERER
jgi:hypothetical protein